MRHVRLIAILCLLPVVSMAQIRIDKASFYFSNIPVLHTYKSYDVFYKTTEVRDFAFSIDSAIVVIGDTVHVSIHSEGGAMYFSSSTIVSFRIDTMTKRLHKFSYNSGTTEDLGRNDQAWTTKNASFDSIDLYRDGNVYRGRMSGTLLAANHMNITDGTYSEYSVGLVNENSYVSIANAFSDTSTLEVVLSGESPLEVSNDSLLDEFSIFPNPASSILTIKGANSNQVEVIDQLGRNQHAPVISTSPNLQLDVSSLPIGYYWLRVGNQVHKFIKQ